MLRFVHLSILYFVCVFTVSGLKVSLENTDEVSHIKSSEASFKIPVKNSTNDTRLIEHRSSKYSKKDKSTKFDREHFGPKAEIVQSASILQKENEGKKFHNLKVAALNKEDQIIHGEEMQKKKLGSDNKFRYKIAKTEAKKKRRKLIEFVKKRKTKVDRGHFFIISQDPVAENKIPVDDGHRGKYLARNVTCMGNSLNDTSASLKRSFRVPKLHKSTDCLRRNEVPFRFSAERKTELINTDHQSKKEQSSDELADEYVHPKGHISSTIQQKSKLHSGSIVSSSKNSAERFSKQNDENDSLSVLIDSFLDSVNDNNAKGETEDEFKQDYFLSSKNKRDLEAFFNQDYRSSRTRKMRDTDRQTIALEEKLFTAAIGSESADHSPDKYVPTTKKQIQNWTLHSAFNSTKSDNVDIINTPWPLVPGPISCDLDFQLQPSFVAKLGEFDYVVSVQLQQNPEQPADHVCTGVIYNPRFIIIAPHCLIDNYGLTVTSTDDLCTIDEMIEVDYIIEHENYDSESRKNDIALIKLKSEIHKRAAVFSKDDETLDNTLYAVGFGELMWRSFPDKISKLLQKVPVRRYSDVLKEAPGTLHITTSHMDMTGAFRGDFGGALVNFQGEFVGLKSKLVKKSNECEVYTRVRTYLPWIKSMVALHGSW